MIEQNSNYAYKLKYMDNPTFDKVRDLSTKFYRELPQALQDELYEALNRGVDILDSEPQMTAYLFAFGKMHQAKLEYAFSKLPEDFLELPEINIVDYGCGQALGTMCYADFLRDNGCSQKVKTITLIEPSEICIKRAALHASVFFPGTDIKTVNKKFDDLTQDDIVYSEETPTLHILSNVLDMTSFDLGKFSGLIKSCLKGSNQFVCVGPYFNYTDKDGRMDEFFSRLDSKEDFRKSFDKYEFDLEKTWTAKILCFSLGKNEGIHLTKSSEYNICDDIEDEFGVVYNKDGNSLVECKNKELVNYNIKDGVKIICVDAFSCCTKLRSITIPDSVTRIGSGAFYGCKSLKDIVIPDSVLEIGKLVFEECDSLRNAFLSKSITKIEFGTFYGCIGLESINIPGSVEEIGDVAFWNCGNLKSIKVGINNTYDSRNDCNALIESENNILIRGCAQTVIPNSVVAIGNSAFSGCKKLKSIIIPNSVKSIGIGSFSDCKELVSIHIPNSVTEIGPHAFSGCENLQEIVIPESVKIINIYTFKGCTSLKKVVIPNCWEICDHAFEGCINLKTIDISNSLWKIGDYAFVDCKGLTNVVVPNSVTEIGQYALGGCESLTSIFIPDSVEEIGRNAFHGCKNLTNIRVGDNNKNYNSPNGCNAIIEDRHSYPILIKGCAKTVIPDFVREIGKCAFEGCEGLNKIIIPDSVAYIKARAFFGCDSLQEIVISKNVIGIGQEAFYGCKKLKNIHFPKSLSIIGDKAFYDCVNLKDIRLPEFVTLIGEEAFYGCKILNSIVIPDSVREIGKGVFGKCINLRTISVGEKNKRYVSRDNCNAIVDSERNILIRGCAETTITKTIKIIGDNAFSGCEDLTNIILPESVTEIDSFAFKECVGLTSIVIPNSVSKIKEGAFSECKSLERIVLPESIAYIDDGVFYCCESLKGIIIPNSVRFIGNYSFKGCKNLTNVVVSGTIDSFGIEAFSNCNSLQQIIISKGNKGKFKHKKMFDKELWDKLVEQ